jgi:hypothetical protein
VIVSATCSSRKLPCLLTWILLLFAAGFWPTSAKAQVPLRVTPDPHRFPDQIQFSCSPPVEFTITSDEPKPLKIISIASSDPERFEIISAPIGMIVPTTYKVRFRAIGIPETEELEALITITANGRVIVWRHSDCDLQSVGHR